MAYTIKLTNGTTFATVPNDAINTQSSMTLIGQNYGNYGIYLDQNFIYILENFSNITPPPNPLVGQLWWNSQKQIMQVYNGSGFKNITSVYAQALSLIHI